ncbi:hypothetical protein [Staphylococcus kloosii]|uniref:Phage protein n=1 Tax=Staphylococcus kloosii TaxID=29384 RepID=A0ABQ0XM59_9STAP|nr:hypothetical protein [Staphylococcus kloosii]AVQ35765.1 hypothetical protein C7J89_06345 [Staphylococcus kloosii]PNZ05461.1 hypothetical protein CD136_07350 [Staphylococcus kloosii]GEP82522.1 hypothetical protein SKL01_17000 [Staphylococcus kloosii]SUM48825.1 phage protein [Staphylococcus kloosii]
MSNPYINSELQKIISDLKLKTNYAQNITNKHDQNLRSIAFNAKKYSDIQSSVVLSLLNKNNFESVNDFLRLQTGLAKAMKSSNSAIMPKRLFSQELIHSFKNTYRFNDEIVFQAQKAIRNLYINPTAISTLVETINTTNPVKNYQYQANDNKFEKMFLDKNALPYNVYVKNSGHFAITTDAGNFLINFINDNSLHVERSLIVVVMALLMYLYSFYPYSKD